MMSNPWPPRLMPPGRFRPNSAPRIGGAFQGARNTPQPQQRRARASIGGPGVGGSSDLSLSSAIGVLRRSLVPVEEKSGGARYEGRETGSQLMLEKKEDGHEANVGAWAIPSLLSISRSTVMKTTTEMEAELAQILSRVNKCANRCWKCAAPSPFVKIHARGLGHELDLRYEEKVRSRTAGALDKAMAVFDKKFELIQEKMKDELVDAIDGFQASVVDMKARAEAEIEQAHKELRMTSGLPPPSVEGPPVGVAKLDEATQQELKRMASMEKIRMEQEAELRRRVCEIEPRIQAMSDDVVKNKLEALEDAKMALERTKRITTNMDDWRSRMRKDLESVNGSIEKLAAALEEKCAKLEEKMSEGLERVREDDAKLALEMKDFARESASKWEENSHAMKSKASRLEVRQLRTQMGLCNEDEQRRVDSKIGELRKSICASPATDKIGDLPYTAPPFEWTKLTNLEKAIQAVRSDLEAALGEMPVSPRTISAQLKALKFEVSRLKDLPLTTGVEVKRMRARIDKCEATLPDLLCKQLEKMLDKNLTPRQIPAEAATDEGEREAPVRPSSFVPSDLSDERERVRLAEVWEDVLRERRIEPSVAIALGAEMESIP